MNVLVDHNLEGYAVLMAGILANGGWLDLIPIRFVLFALTWKSIAAIALWQVVQNNQMILLTANRSLKRLDSL